MGRLHRKVFVLTASAALFVSTLLALSGAAPKDAVRVPAGVNTTAMMELTQFGEVVFLPERNRNPFSAVIFTHGNAQCSSMKGKMLNVAGYPKLWDHIEGETIIRKKTAKTTRYALQLDLPLAPDLEGLVEDAGRNRVVFHDVETGGSFHWSLRDVGPKCHMRYTLYQPPGKESPFVTLLRKMEDGVGDAAEVSAALATARGYASNTSRRAPHQISDRAQHTMEVLAGKGIALRVLRNPNGNVAIMGKRRVALSPANVLQKIRNRHQAARNADFLDDVEAEDGGHEWAIRYFKGSVDFVTHTQENGAADAPGGITIREAVKSGDIENGSWTWRVREVDGGTDIELLVDLDVTKGSYVLSSLTRHDTTIRDAARFQMVLSFLGDHIGGRPLPAANDRVAAR